ncbi:hypothetical protein GOB44_07610 [Sinorhizobium meliloti]|uniref:Transposase n=1 Tax=Rhizobium meliloti TaxID=382 RepID=A0AAW9U055_RHIML|nr:hypothetical protein [Sinorhizobium meliloti]MDW9748065.1 hypothetical protein [Sinorhizobium meliloti]MDW9803496.1 hypothetical protein [Sinorhizobium meliloti]MDX0364432.1 hypothetical protein [Sinorhizobium meliloti]MQW37426.1 hypothetical protein [Sinorhizobium meliloti]
MADTNRAAAGDCCSSERDVFFILAGAQLPCSIQGNRFERRLRIFYSQQNGNQGKAPDLPAGLWTFLRGGEWISPQRLGNLPPVMSAHTGYSQQFCSGQMLQISDHLIPGLV